MNKAKTSLRVAELDTLSDVLVRLYKDYSSDANGTVAEDANLKAVMTDVESLSAALTTAIKSDKVTSSLDEADIARDEAVRSLSDALNGYAALPIPEKKAAAQNLLAIFQKYGKSITTKNYAEESSLIESLLEDLSAADAKANVETLEGVGEIIKNLRSAQDNFNKANDEFTHASVTKGQSASSVKKPLLEVLNTRLVPYLSAVALSGGYKEFALKCGAEIDKANAAVTGRKK